jgi:hypothetical protein
MPADTWGVTRVRPSRRALCAAFAAAACALALTACGSSGGAATIRESAKPPGQILTDVRAVVAHATSVHLAGHVSSSTPIAIDLHLSRTGGSGTVASSGLRFEVTRIAKAAYFTGTQGFYRHFTNHAGIVLLNGRWLKVPASDPRFRSFAALTDMNGLLGQILRPTGAVVKAGTKTVDGVRVVGLRDTSHGTLYVATTGTPYPVEIVNTGAHAGLVRFDQWNRTITLHAPANPVRLGQLTRAGG